MKAKKNIENKNYEYVKNNNEIRNIKIIRIKKRKGIITQVQFLVLIIKKIMKIIISFILKFIRLLIIKMTLMKS